MRCITPLLIYLIAPPVKLHMLLISAALLGACPVECTNVVTGEIRLITVPTIDLVNYFFPDGELDTGVEEIPLMDPTIHQALPCEDAPSGS
jgi:hypothetical protein